MRSSCATSEVKRRSRACACESAVIFASSASAISLNDAAQAPNSSALSTGMRVSRSPSASDCAAALARPTGASVRRARSAPTSVADERQDQHADEEDRAELAELVLELLLGEDEVELRVGAGDLAADHDAPARPPSSTRLYASWPSSTSAREVLGNLRGVERHAGGDVAAPPRVPTVSKSAAALEGREQLVGRLLARAFAEHLRREPEIEPRLGERAVDRVVQARCRERPA